MSKNKIKIIQTLWTKPYFEKKDNFGFDKIETFFNSLILSVNAAKENYDNIILYTDTPGLKLLEPYMDRLPYSKVYTILDELDHIPSFLWAFPKIYVYSLQLKPFLHIDNDFYLWGNVSVDKSKVDIICQNIEIYIKDAHIFPHYRNALNEIGHFFPQEYGFKDATALNAGIYGALNEKGLNMFRKMYLDAVRILQIIEAAQPSEANKYYKYSKSINCFIEQAFGWRYAIDNKLKYATMLEGSHLLCDAKCNTSSEFAFTHLMGHLKLLSGEIDRLEERIKNKKYQAGGSSHFSL